jgi:hypothetical protein
MNQLFRPLSLFELTAGHLCLVLQQHTIAVLQSDGAALLIVYVVGTLDLRLLIFPSRTHASLFLCFLIFSTPVDYEDDDDNDNDSQWEQNCQH